MQTVLIVISLILGTGFISLMALGFYFARKDAEKAMLLKTLSDSLEKQAQMRHDYETSLESLEHGKGSVDGAVSADDASRLLSGQYTPAKGKPPPSSQ